MAFKPSVASRTRLAAALLALLAGSSLCAAPPNILVFIADDAGLDFGCYGNDGIRTPHIDRLAASGLLFENAFLTTSQCSPSRLSLLSGQFAHTLGVEDLHTPLPEGVALLPSYLEEAGYFTGIMMKRHLGRHGNRQFRWQGTSSKAVFHEQAAEQFSSFLDEAGERPFFLWMAFIDPHRPYGQELGNPELAAPRVHGPGDVRLPPYLPDTEESRLDHALYYDAIARMDTRIGEMLQALDDRGLREDTVILFLSDNGAPMPREKATAYDAGIKTPFIVSWKGRIAAGERYAGLASLIDLAPTLLDIAGKAKDASMFGESLLPTLLDPTLPGRERIFAERNWHGTEAHMRVVRGERYKLILNGFPERQFPITGNYPRMGSWRELLRLKQRGELTHAQARLFEYPRPAVEFYDMQEDPHELNNLAYDLAYRKQIDAYISELRAWQAKTGDHAPHERPILPDLLDRATGIRLQREMTHAQWPREE